MNIDDHSRFNQLYQAYLNELTLQGKSPKTIDMYSRYLYRGGITAFYMVTPNVPCTEFN